MSLELRFRRFLIELILEWLSKQGRNGGATLTRETTLAVAPYGQFTQTPSGVRYTKKQATLLPRRGLETNILTVKGKRYVTALGDTRKRRSSHVVPSRGGGAFPVLTPWQPVALRALPEILGTDALSVAGTPELLTSTPALFEIVDYEPDFITPIYGPLPVLPIPLDALYLRGTNFVTPGGYPLPWAQRRLLGQPYPDLEPYHYGYYDPVNRALVSYPRFVSTMVSGDPLQDTRLPSTNFQENGKSYDNVDAAPQLTASTVKAVSKPGQMRIFSLDPDGYLILPGTLLPWGAEDIDIIVGPVRIEANNETFKHYPHYFTSGGTFDARFSPETHTTYTRMVYRMVLDNYPAEVVRTNTYTFPLRCRVALPEEFENRQGFYVRDDQTGTSMVVHASVSDLQAVYGAFDTNGSGGLDPFRTSLVRIADGFASNGLGDNDPYARVTGLEDLGDGTTRVSFDRTVTMVAGRHMALLVPLWNPGAEEDNFRFNNPDGEPKAARYRFTETAYPYPYRYPWSVLAYQSGGAYELRYEGAMQLDVERLLRLEKLDDNGNVTPMLYSTSGRVDGSRPDRTPDLSFTPSTFIFGYHNLAYYPYIDPVFLNYGYTSHHVPLGVDAVSIAREPLAYSLADQTPIASSGPAPQKGELMARTEMTGIEAIDWHREILGLDRYYYPEGGVLKPLHTASVRAVQAPKPNPTAFRDGTASAAYRADVSKIIPVLFSSPDATLQNPLGAGGESLWYGLTWTSLVYVCDAFRADVTDAEGSVTEHLYAVALIEDAGLKVLVSVDRVLLGVWNLWDFFPTADGTLKFLSGETWPLPNTLLFKMTYNPLHPDWPHEGAGYLPPFSARVRSKEDKVGKMFTVEAADSPVTLFLESYPDNV